MNGSPKWRTSSSKEQQKFGDITLHIKASELIGMKEVIRRKIIKGLPLWEVDKVWLKNNLK